MVTIMTDIKKDNRGYLYRNNNKTKPTQPDFTGKITHQGKEIRLSAWENKSPEGKQYLSLASSEPLENSSPKPPPESKVTPKTENISKQDEDDLDAILKLTDDDNPFG